MSISPRERVLTAINHQEPDRVPLSLWGSWYGITDQLYFDVIKLMGWEPVDPFRPDLLHSVNYYDDRLLELLHIDVRHVDSGAIVKNGRTRPDGSDAFGIIWDIRDSYRTVRIPPLENASVEQIMEYPFPSPDDAIDAELITTRLQEISKMDQEYAIVGRAVASYGPFEMAQSMRRNEKLYIDMVMNPDIVDALVGRLFDCYTGLILRFLEIGGDQLDMIELPGDDFAGNKNTLISLAMYDRFFKEPYRRLIDRIKQYNPDIKVIFHSDGAMAPFLPRLIEIGVDIFHPLEPLPATNFIEIKQKYGDKLVFMGGIDIRTALQGEKDKIDTEVKTRIYQLAAGGGYILAPSNHIQWDVPPENLIRLFDAAVEYGSYPINIDIADVDISEQTESDDRTSSNITNRMRPSRHSARSTI